jgi:ubiquinone/menaquinone biosynthesis C-methylase UbiE
MHGPTEYDAFADIYDVWVETARITERDSPFYLEEYLRTEGGVVELGVGSGRIAIEAARQGKEIVGVDNSTEMLKLCRERAQAAGVAGRLTLIQADMRAFTLPEPAQLITIPFRTIGMLVSLEDKRTCLRRVYDQLAPGGRFIFDFLIFNPEAARQRHGVVSLRAEYTDAATGHDMLLWTTAQYNMAAQTMRLITWTDELNDQDVLLRRQYRRLSFSWLDPEQARALLEETGFEVEAVYGDFDRRPFTEDSTEQIWVARRTAH